MAAEGLFGSNVGASRSAPRMLPGIAAEKIAMPKAKALPKAPTFHVVAPKHATKSEMGETGRSSSSGWSVAAPIDAVINRSGGRAASSGGSHDWLGEVAGGAESFIGNLSADTVHMAVGFFPGLIQMAHHPIGSLEQAATSTWQDWSPLYRAGDAYLNGNTSEAGRELGVWGHHFFAHPLAPLLDVVSVLTLGAGTAARGASVVSKLGDATALTEEDAAAAGKLASAGPTHAPSSAYPGGYAPGAASKAVTEGEIRAAAAERGAQGLVSDSTYKSLARFANPEKYGRAAYENIAKNLGLTGDQVNMYVDDAMSADGTLRHIVKDEAGVTVRSDRLNRNPLLRARDRQLHSLANKIAESGAGKAVSADYLFGKAAIIRRASHLEGGARRAAVTDLVAKHMNALYETLDSITHVGGLLHHMSGTEAVKFLTFGMVDGIVAQGMETTAAGIDLAAWGRSGMTAGRDDAAEAAQAAAVKDSKRVYVANSATRGKNLLVEQQKITDAAAKDAANGWVKSSKEATGPLETAALSKYFKGSRDEAGKMTPSGFAKAVTTEDHREAEIGADGKFRLSSASGRAANDLGEEALNAGKLARTIWYNPVKLWRYALLGLSPRYFVNNFFGNGLMAMAATDPVTFFTTLVDRFRMGKFAERQFAKRMDEVAKKGGSASDIALEQSKLAADFHVHRTWINKWYSGEHAGFAQSNYDRAAAEEQGKIDFLNRHVSIHGFTHKYADRPYREAAVLAAIKRTPEFQREYARLRALGTNRIEAMYRAGDKASESEGVRQLVREQVRHTMGQYHTFTGGEKNVRQAVPFYAWQRHISRHMMTLITQEPYKVAMGAAIGSVGGYSTQQILGNVPDFLGGAIPAKILGGPMSPILSLLGANSANGRTPVLNALTLSPYSSVADLVKTGNALFMPGGKGLKGVVTGDTLGGQLNPLIQASAQSLSGTDLQTGAPLPPGKYGLIPGLYQQTFGNIPEWGLISALLGTEQGNTTKAGKPTMYQHNFQEVLSSWLGLPVRNVNLQTAHAEYAKEYGVKKSKRGPFTVKITGMPGL